MVHSFRTPAHFHLVTNTPLPLFTDLFFVPYLAPSSLSLIPISSRCVYARFWRQSPTSHHMHPYTLPMDWAAVAVVIAFIHKIQEFKNNTCVIIKFTIAFV